MKLKLRTRPSAYACTALAAAATLAAFAPSAYAFGQKADPSAYGIAATGPDALSARPAVDWTAGPGLTAQAGGLGLGPLSIAAISVDAGDGYADSHLTGLSIGGNAIGSVTASCRDGVTSLAVGGAGLHPGAQVELPGGITVSVGQTSADSDGSTSITALTITVPSAAGPEIVTLGQARCGQP
jgi:hypothetical protein